MVHRSTRAMVVVFLGRRAGIELGEGAEPTCSTQDAATAITFRLTTVVCFGERVGRGYGERREGEQSGS